MSFVDHVCLCPLVTSPMGHICTVTVLVLVCAGMRQMNTCTAPEMGMQQLTGVLAVLSVLLQPTIGMDFHAVLGSYLQKARKIPVLHHSTLALFQGFHKKTTVEVTVQNKGEGVVCCDRRTLQHDPDYCGFCDGAQDQV